MQRKKDILTDISGGVLSEDQATDMRDLSCQ
jgi:hypothetical protein